MVSTSFSSARVAPPSLPPAMISSSGRAAITASICSSSPRTSPRLNVSNTWM